jgi:hypothetical protein
MEERMGNEPPSWLNSWVKLHVLGPTHVSHEASCTPSSCVPFCTCSPFEELRIKTYISHNFWNNIKLLFVRNQAPKLSPPFQPSSPFFPYPLCGSLVPHHSFFMVGLHAVKFIYYINDLHNYIYKIVLFSLILRLSGLINT